MFSSLRVSYYKRGQQCINETGTRIYARTTIHEDIQGDAANRTKRTELVREIAQQRQVACLGNRHVKSIHVRRTPKGHDARRRSRRIAPLSAMQMEPYWLEICQRRSKGDQLLQQSKQTQLDWVQSQQARRQVQETCGRGCHQGVCNHHLCSFL